MRLKTGVGSPVRPLPVSSSAALSVEPTKAAVPVETPSIEWARSGTSSMNMPGASNSAMDRHPTFPGAGTAPCGLIGNPAPLSYRAAMERLDGGSAVPAGLRGGVVALGNFDGFHLGHQAVVGRAVARARAEGRPALVATFDPHPMRYFRPESPWFRLTTMDQRARLLKAAGVDAMFVFHFDETFAALTPEGFVSEWLAGRLGAAGVVTGEDFTF